jgi:predicted HTH transcriptional regulator
MTKDEILSGESDVLEFKRDVPEQSVKYIKTVVAFANGKGGTLVFGVDDKTHKVVGIKKSEVFQKADSIANTIFNSCEPKIRPSINQTFAGRK